MKLLPVRPPPTELMRYFSGEHEHSLVFLKEIRRLNSSLAFASLEADEKHVQGQGTPAFRMHGCVYHVVGTLEPQRGKRPTFLSLYIWDSDNELNH